MPFQSKKWHNVVSGDDLAPPHGTARWRVITSSHWEQRLSQAWPGTRRRSDRRRPAFSKNHALRHSGSAEAAHTH